MDNEKLDLIVSLVQGMANEQKAMRSEFAEMRADLKATREAVEVVAVEQAKLRDEMTAIGRRISRVEQADADLWQAIDRLRPAH